VGVGVEADGGCKHVLNPQSRENSEYGTTYEQKIIAKKHLTAGSS
jgi:hypothetical protein